MRSRSLGAGPAPGELFSSAPGCANRSASASAWRFTKSLFMKYRFCSGTLVTKRFSAVMLGSGKSKVCR